MHGGPGAGSHSSLARFLDPQPYRIGATFHAGQADLQWVINT
jgi:hypothetical protein